MGFILSDQSGRMAARKKRRVRIAFGVENPVSEGFTLDLSETGAFVCAPDLFYPGLKLRLLLETQQGNLSLEGRVVWICDDRHPPRTAHEAGMGLQWLATDDQYLDYFNAL